MSEDFEDALDDQPERLPRVAASEADLLVMARALVAGPDAQDDIWSLLCAGRALHPRIGETCADLLEDTLRQVWRALAQRGGTRPRVSIAGDGTTARGRLWERHAVVPLEFTSATVALLRWLVSQSFAAAPSTIAELPAMPLAIGDQVMIYLALDAARATPAARVIAGQPLVAAAPLAWLGFTPLLAAQRRPPPESFAPLVTGAGAIVVEALADELAARWYAGELTKRQLEDPAELVALGGHQDQVLTRFMAACDGARRRDLARWVLDAATPLFARNLSPHVVALDPRRPLSERAQARVAAGALMRAIERWNAWDQLHRGVRYFDDDYQAAQLLLQHFERIGPPGVARAQGWLADLASLAPSAPTQPDSQTP
jgi:FtsH ternary system-associated peptide